MAFINRLARRPTSSGTGESRIVPRRGFPSFFSKLDPKLTMNFPAVVRKSDSQIHDRDGEGRGTSLRFTNAPRTNRLSSRVITFSTLRSSDMRLSRAPHSGAYEFYVISLLRPRISRRTMPERCKIPFCAEVDHQWNALTVPSLFFYRSDRGRSSKDLPRGVGSGCPPL